MTVYRDPIVKPSSRAEVAVVPCLQNCLVFSAPPARCRPCSAYCRLSLSTIQPVMADTMQASNPGSLLDTLQYWDTQLSSTAAGYFTRLYAGFYTISIVASLWVYFVARRLPPGLARALVCLPVVVLQLAATPVLVDRTRTAVLIVPVCGILSLAAFKVRTAANGMSVGLTS